MLRHFEAGRDPCRQILPHKAIQGKASLPYSSEKGSSLSSQAYGNGLYAAET